MNCLEERYIFPGSHLEKPLNSSNFLNNGPIRSVFSTWLRISRGTILVSQICEISWDLAEKRDCARSRFHVKSKNVKVLRFWWSFFLNRSEFSKDYKNINRFAKFLFLESLKGKKMLLTLHIGRYTISCM